MNTSGNTLLVTGGATGIGRALAERFLGDGNTVILCGRRSEMLQEAKERHPQVHTFVCDLAQESERIRLFKEISRDFPRINVLVNNAGIQRRVKLAETSDPWSLHQQEIAINFEAPIHLSLMFLPLLKEQEAPTIINVTSGLAFTPMPGAAVYSATKAALHSFTLSLRTQIESEGVDVIEIVPPAVQTDLGGAGLHLFGVPLDEFADAVYARMKAGEKEIGYGTAEHARRATREEVDAALVRMAQLRI